jgi:hypothetical protein
VNLVQTIEIYLPVPQMFAFIRKQGDRHCVKSHSGRNLGCYESASGARKRLKQVEYFKHVKAADDQTYYGPNTGGLGPSDALGSPE